MIFDPSVKNPFQRPIGWISGDKIDIDTSKYLHVDYGVQLTSIINKVGDNSCDNYPSQDHYSYEVCVRAELAGKVKPVFGCMIPWMSNKDACDKPVPITPSRTKLIEWARSIVNDAFGGAEYYSENCKLPCSAYATHVSRQAVSTSLQEETTIFIHIKRNVKVRKIVLSYDKTSLLVEIGSCLGMWLGLSVVGMFDIAAVAIVRVKQLLRP